jgi:hypothetical protein
MYAYTTDDDGNKLPAFKAIEAFAKTFERMSKGTDANPARAFNPGHEDLQILPAADRC